MKKGPILLPWNNAEIGSKLLEKICPGSQLDKCVITSGNRKYKLSNKPINRLFTCLSSSKLRCGCLHGTSAWNDIIWDQRGTGLETEKVALWDQASNCIFF